MTAAVTDAVAAFVVAVLSGMGVGGGGLFVLYLTVFRGAEQLAAQGANLLFFLFSSGASMLVHIRKRNILWGPVLLMTVLGIPASLAGGYIAGLLPQGVVAKIFGTVLAATGVVALFRK